MAVATRNGRKPANDDFQETPVWIEHAETGLVHKVYHKYHIQRLLAEGGRVVDAPKDVTADASTQHDERLNNPHAAEDSRSVRSKPAVR